MSGKCFVHVQTTDIKPTWAIHGSQDNPAGELFIGPSPAPVLRFEDPAGLGNLVDLIRVACELRDGLHEAQARVAAQARTQDVSLPGLGAQGEPATGRGSPDVNTGQGHTHEPPMCALPDDCPLGPEPHVFVPPDVPGIMCCCKQPWEEGSSDLEPSPPLPQRTPAGPPAHPWQAAMDAQLSPEALAGSVPLATLAPEQEDEAEA